MFQSKKKMKVTKQGVAGITIPEIKKLANYAVKHEITEGFYGIVTSDVNRHEGEYTIRDGPDPNNSIKIYIDKELLTATRGEKQIPVFKKQQFLVGNMLFINHVMMLNHRLTIDKSSDYFVIDPLHPGPRSPQLHVAAGMEKVKLEATRKIKVRDLYKLPNHSLVTEELHVQLIKLTDESIKYGSMESAKLTFADPEMTIMMKVYIKENQAWLDKLTQDKHYVLRNIIFRADDPEPQIKKMTITTIREMTAKEVNMFGVVPDEVKLARHHWSGQLQYLQDINFNKWCSLCEKSLNFCKHKKEGSNGKEQEYTYSVVFVGRVNGRRDKYLFKASKFVLDDYKKTAIRGESQIDLHNAFKHLLCTPIKVFYDIMEDGNNIVRGFELLNTETGLKRKRVGGGETRKRAKTDVEEEEEEGGEEPEVVDLEMPPLM